jgi:hypothetical protein
MAEQLCDEGGMMVGAKRTLPSDIREHCKKGGPIIGCNRLYCDTCGSWLRNVAGAKIDVAEMSRAEHERFYEEIGQGITAWPFLTTNISGELFRVYACRCDWDQTSGIKWLYQSERDGWHCAGHVV